MERGSKNKFKMKSSALRAGESIMGRFMAMGKTLGNSKADTKATIDPSKYYTSPNKPIEKEEESAVEQNKREKATLEIAKRKDDAKIKDDAKTTSEDKADAEHFTKK